MNIVTVLLEQFKKVLHHRIEILAYWKSPIKWVLRISAGKSNLIRLASFKAGIAGRPSKNFMNEQTELLREMRDLLLVMAEPALAKRDEKRRAQLQEIVGKSKPRAKAVHLMDGTRSQTTIKNESGIDAGGLSRCVKALREASLLAKDENPKLVITIPPNFFEQTEDQK